MMLRICALMLLLACAEPGAAEELVLAGATVHTMAGETLERADLLITDGVITAVGVKVEATTETVRVDLSGLHLYPALVALDTSLGLSEINAVRATLDVSEVGAITPDVEAWIAVNPDSELIPVARAGGIAHAEIVPLGGRIPGLSGFISLDGWTTEEMTVLAPAALHLSWPAMALAVEPPRPGSPARKDWKAPTEQARERAVQLRELEEVFLQAGAYGRARAADSERPLVPSWEAMQPALDGRIPVMVRASEIRQIEALLDWARRLRDEESPMRLIVVGGREAWRVAPALAELDLPVVFEHVFTLPVRDSDPDDAQFRAASRLAAAGVKLAFSGGSGPWAAAEQRNLPFQAAQAAAFGLEPEQAVAAITRIPAEILGLGERLGAIAPGLDATLIAVAGDLLDIKAPVTRMWIRGREVSLESRHTRLHERYRNRPPR